MPIYPLKKDDKKTGNKNPYKEVDSSFSDIIRSIIPAPTNVAQMISKQVFGDSRMSNNSLSDDQKLILWDVIQRAQKRSGKANGGGTEYEDYGDLGYGSKDDFNRWFNRGDVGVVELGKNSLTNDGFKLASTIGRGRYWQDEKDPETVYYTDVYDWNSGENNFSGDGLYQKLRNHVRGTEDKNLNADKNEKSRMNFKLTRAEIEEIRRKKNGVSLDNTRRAEPAIINTTFKNDLWSEVLEKERKVGFSKGGKFSGRIYPSIKQ